MKKILTLAFLALFLVFTIGVVSAVSGNGVGNPDNECQNNGFDFGIAKYECSSTTAEEGSAYDNYNITVSWVDDGDDCESVDWIADPAVDGVLSKEATETFIHSGGISGTITKGKHGISHVTFCGKEVPPTIPEFGIVIWAVTLMGAVVIFFVVRRK